MCKTGHPRLNCSREIPPVAVGSGISDSFCYNFRPEEDNDVISDVLVGMAARVKFGDSRSAISRDIRGADFVSNERTT